VLHILRLAADIKEQPHLYRHAMQHRTLVMFFEKPSLRTRLSFETGMTRMGGHAIFYHTNTLLQGLKESPSDTIKVVSRYADIVMARVKTRRTINLFAQHATVPVINALDDFAHPCQIVADLFSIREHFNNNSNNRNKQLDSLRAWRTIKLAYFGDTRNNVTYDLMRAGALMGFHVAVCGPRGAEFAIEQCVLDECAALCKRSGGKVEWTHDVQRAAAGADAVYTDSWMSYGIAASEKKRRLAALTPYRVTQHGVMRHAKRDAIFMNCLPAMRGMEQTARVIDGAQSIVFDQAENRMHAQNALLLFLFGLSNNCKRNNSSVSMLMRSASLNASAEAKQQQQQQQQLLLPANRPLRLVIAWGGNALNAPGKFGDTEATRRVIRHACQDIVTLVQRGHHVLLVHGNGPQVGMELIRNKANTEHANAPAAPLDVCVAATRVRKAVCVCFLSHLHACSA
jgi:ornithine carbamoyltransferase